MRVKSQDSVRREQCDPTGVTREGLKLVAVAFERCRVNIRGQGFRAKILQSSKERIGYCMMLFKRLIKKVVTTSSFGVANCFSQSSTGASSDDVGIRERQAAYMYMYSFQRHSIE